MHVLLVTHRFERHSIGGTEVLTNDIARALAARGHRVVWLAVGQDDARNDSTFRERSDGILEWEISPGFAADYPLRWREQEASQSRKVRIGSENLRLEFTVAHVFHFARIGLGFFESETFAPSRIFVTLTDYTSVCPDYQLFRRATETICSAEALASDCLHCLALDEGESDVESWRQRNVDFLNERATGIFTQTPEQRRILVAAGVRNEQFVCDRAHYDVPLEWTRPSGKRRERGEEHPYRFGFFGRLSPEKGLHVVLDILPQLFERSGCELRIYGAPGSDATYMERLAEAIEGAGTSATLYGSVPHARLADELRSIDCLLIPSVWLENHPMILTYAMTLGVPVICSRLKSLAHLERTEGLTFVEPGDRPAWLHAMEAMACTPMSGRLHYPDSIGMTRGGFELFVDRLVSNYEMSEA